MTKISALDLMKKNYNVQLEAEKLKQFFFEAPMFRRANLFTTNETFTYSSVFDELMLRNWKFRQTYITTKEMFTQNDLYLDFSKKYTNEQLINFLELINNILYVKPNYELIRMRYDLIVIENNYKLMLEILAALIINLGLDEKKDPDGWYVLIPKNEVLDKAIEDFSPAVQWEIVSYLKIKNDDLESKRKQLAHLATELYIEKDSTEKGYRPFDTIMNECTLILNNLHIRHNNETGKWENDVIKNINNSEAVEYCDMLYNKMLQIILIRKDLKRQSKIDSLSKSLKNK